MSIPGFTAEVSAYKSNLVYRAADFLSQASNSSQTMGIALAFLPRGSGSYLHCWQVCQGDPGCIQCCICISHGGHPSECCF